MFYTYILTSRGEKVDFDRAARLMDMDLFEQANEAAVVDPFDLGCAMRSGMAGHLKSRAQRVWNCYVKMHREKFGEEFGPDATPGWDQ
ncbi:hypothetical protein [uncultured Paracoccus sp.]|uniref:hypothetical protein n=1 Tax=uncultured Paracoccus sp. TaxID=189685 RepID=UPI00261F6139|nr:hypothetical protein [uncultured Paracoccus sp.]